MSDTADEQHRSRTQRHKGVVDASIARASPSRGIALVVLDEINIALKLHYLQIGQVLEALRNRPPMQHVALTGRAAPDALIEYADTVTEMRPIKHAFEAGIQAQKGIEL